MVDLDESTMAALAREMAMAIRDYKAIFEDFKITEEDYYEISKQDFFKRAKEQFSLEWNSAASAADRTRLISAAYAEELLPIVGKGVKDENKPLSDRLECYKTLCKNAGIGEQKSNFANPSERFVITINLGADTEHYDKSIAVDANDITPSKLSPIVKPAEIEKPKRGRPTKAMAAAREAAKQKEL